MRKLVQSVRSGELTIVDAPDPVIGATEVLVATTHSVISAGTERAVHNLASASLLQKAKARPDLVRQVIRKARTEGIRSTYSAVQTRLDDEMSLGYSGAGVVVAVGGHVSGVRPGMRVATGGAGHGDLQVVAGHLAVPVPEGVSSDEACFATVASIALHGLRLTEVGPGGKICVIGLGLIGQLAVRLARASGLDVVGVDVRDWTIDTAIAGGAHGLVERGADTTQAILDWSRGRGVDAVLITAATPSSEPVRRATAIARDRATIVVVGDVGLELERAPLYEKELTIRVARSYGPGRYDRSYEEWAVDYPIGHVRWTEGRNLEAVLDLMSSGRLNVNDLITHRFSFGDVESAFVMMSRSDERFLGIQLEYPETRVVNQGIPAPVVPADPNAYRIGLIGAGNFARLALVPSIGKSGLGAIVAVASAGGTSAAKLAGQVGAQAVTPDQLLDDPNVDIVVIATSHSTHAELATRALIAGKHVFCEKPLALTEDELDAVENAWRTSGKHLFVGFNRRYSEALSKAKDALAGGASPLVIVYRVNAGSVPDDHWYNDRREGGRLIGEICHFVDVCNHLTDSPIKNVNTAGVGKEMALADNVALTLSYQNGSVATIAYSTGGHSSTSKEYLSILGRGHTVEIEDFVSLRIDGHRIRMKNPSKGHIQELVAFKEAIAARIPSATDADFDSMRVALQCVGSLGVRSACL